MGTRKSQTGGFIKLEDILKTSVERNTIYISAEAFLETNNLKTKEQARALGNKCLQLFTAKYKWRRQLRRVVHIDIDACNIKGEFAFVLVAVLKLFRVKYRFIANDLTFTSYNTLFRNIKFAEEVVGAGVNTLKAEEIREIVSNRLTELITRTRHKRRNVMINLIKSDIKKKLIEQGKRTPRKIKVTRYEGTIIDCLLDIRKDFQEYLK